MERREPSSTVGGNVSWCSHYGDQSGGPLKTEKQNCPMTLQFHSWRWYTRRAYCIAQETIQFSSVVSNSLRPHGLQHTRPPCPSPTPRVYSNSCPLSRWCHPATSSVVPFSSHLQSFPASGSFPRSQLFASGGQSIGVSASASVLPMNIQDWFPLGWTSLIFVYSKGLARVFSNTKKLSFIKKKKNLGAFVVV